MQQTCKPSILPRLYLHQRTKRKFRKLLSIWNSRQKTHSVQVNTVKIQAYQSVWFLSILAMREAGVVPASRYQLSFPHISVGFCPGPQGYGELEAQNFHLSHELHMPRVVVTQQLVFYFYSALVFYSVLVRQNTKTFYYLRENKWSANLFALLHKVQQCV